MKKHFLLVLFFLTLFLPAWSQMRGDLNSDNQVDVSDVNIIIDMVLGKQAQNLSTADLDGNNLIDVADVNIIIDIILGIVPQVEPEKPEITVSDMSLSLVSPKNKTCTKTITVGGKLLTSDITVKLTNDNGLFSVIPNRLSTSGGTLTVTYAPTTIGTHTAQLQLSSENVEPVTISLTGTVPEYNTPPTQTFTVNGVSFTMVGVQGGTFMMGADDNESEAFSSEKPLHQVMLSSFSIGETEVTQELWEAVMGSNPSFCNSDRMGIDMSKYPVESVSWDDCQEFVAQLSSLTGRNFRLPTDAEWEYAARGGQQSKGYRYAGSNNLGDVCNYVNGQLRGVLEAGSLAPNELGIYNMSGNVAEWCQDWLNSAYYAHSPLVNPPGAAAGFCRVCRGGNMGNKLRYLTVWAHDRFESQVRSATIGLRLALDQDKDQVVSVSNDNVIFSGVVGTTYSKTVTVSGKTGSVTIEGGNEAFTISQNNLTGTGGSLTIAFTPTAPGTYSALLRIKGNNVPEATIALRGTATKVETPGTETHVVCGIPFNVVMVKSGTFTMGATAEQGSTNASELPTHDVTLPSYYIGQTEVIQPLWTAVMGSNPSWFKGDSLPVEEVSWEECQMFVAELSAITGRKFRLPTEAEWEYAARGGHKSMGFKFSGSNTSSEVGWSYVYEESTMQICTKMPNELGIYDMSGNVWEWCQDWFSKTYYSESPVFNPTGPESGSERVQRGGSWAWPSGYSRVARRMSDEPDMASNDVGFRIVVELAEGDNP